jgi:hypothetical protein
MLAIIPLVEELEILGTFDENQTAQQSFAGDSGFRHSVGPEPSA